MTGKHADLFDHIAEQRAFECLGFLVPGCFHCQFLLRQLVQHGGVKLGVITGILVGDLSGNGQDRAPGGGVQCQRWAGGTQYQGCSDDMANRFLTANTPVPALFKTFRGRSDAVDPSVC